ncbi:unnamed protein product [Closterium sp. NIES-53]
MPHYVVNYLSGYANIPAWLLLRRLSNTFLSSHIPLLSHSSPLPFLSSPVPLLSFSPRALVERITGMDIKSPLGLPSPRKPHYIINFLPGYAYLANLEAFIDFSAMAPPALLSSILEGNSASLPPVFFNNDLRVGTVMIVPIFRHLVPENATLEQRRASVSPTAWTDLSYMGNELQDVLHLLHNDSSASSYSIALYDTTDPQQPIQVLGPDPVKMESGALFPYVLPGPVVPYPKHIESFPDDLLDRKYEAHCRFEGPYPSWDLVVAPMLLGLLVLVVAVLLSLVIAVLAWKRRQMAEGVREMQLCTAALERAEKSKSETVANTSHELRTPLIGVIGMIEELLESQLEEWQREDLRIARACAGETVELINRVLDLAKLQAGRLQLETLPCCLRRIVHEAISATSAVDEQIAPGKNLQVTCHVEESVPDVLMGDPTRLAQVVEELTAHAMSNVAGGQVAFHVCCIPPPPLPHASTRRFHLPCASASAAVSPASSPPHASSSHHLPSGSPAWHQLSACVRRFPPSTHLARLPQRHVARGNRGGAGQAGGTSELPHESPLTHLSRFLQRMGASGTGGSKKASVGEEGEEAQGGSGHGRLEEEVREWVEGVCAAREEGEWMVVMACEDSGGGILPEELRWVLDPYGDSHHAAAAHPSRASVAGSAGGDGNGNDGDDTKDTFFPHLFSRRGSRAAATAALTHDQRSAARPRWTPYPVRFLLSTALVAEMRGDMAVLSHAATGTTILLALPMGGGEDSGSFDDWGEDEESGGERDGCGSGSDGESVEFASVAMQAPGQEQASLQEHPPGQQQQQQASVEQQQQQAPLQQRAARAHSHSHLEPQAGIVESLERAVEADRVLPAEEKSVAVVGKAGRRAARLHSIPKSRSHTDGMGDSEEEEKSVAVVGRAGQQAARSHSLPKPGQQQASLQQHPFGPQQEPLQQRAARALSRRAGPRIAQSHSLPKPHSQTRAGIFESLERAGEADRVLPAVAAAAPEEGVFPARSHSLPKPLSHTDGMGDTEGGQVRAVAACQTVSGRRITRAQSLQQLHAHGERAAGEAEALVRAAVAGRGVAVVDDNAVNRMVARRTLQGYGAHVLLLPSGEEALQALSNATPSAPPIQLLLLDLHMPPGIDGFETARQIRAMESAQCSSSKAAHQMPEGDNAATDAAAAATAAAETAAAAAASAIDASTSVTQERLCIIALTADLDVGVKRACLEAGMDGAVRKPIVAQELLGALITAGFGAGVC